MNYMQKMLCGWIISHNEKINALWMNIHDEMRNALYMNIHDEMNTRQIGLNSHQGMICDQLIALDLEAQTLHKPRCVKRAHTTYYI